MGEQEALNADEMLEGWILCCVSDVRRGVLELDA